MGVDRDRDKETRNSDSVSDLLDHHSCGTQGGIGQVLSAKVVYDDTDGEVGAGADGLTGVENPVVLSGFFHFSHDAEERRGSTVSDCGKQETKIK